MQINIADANFELLSEEGDLATVGRRIQVPLDCWLGHRAGSSNCWASVSHSCCWDGAQELVRVLKNFKTMRDPDRPRSSYIDQVTAGDRQNILAPVLRFTSVT